MARKGVASPHVFISYDGREQALVAERLAEGLREAGTPIWMDASDVRPGVSWSAAIEEAIDEASAYVLVVGDRTLSRSGAKELSIVAEQVWDHRDRPVVSIVVGDGRVPAAFERYKTVPVDADRIDDRGYVSGVVASVVEGLRSPAASVVRRPPADLARSWQDRSIGIASNLRGELAE